VPEIAGSEKGRMGGVALISQALQSMADVVDIGTASVKIITKRKYGDTGSKCSKEAHHEKSKSMAAIDYFDQDAILRHEIDTPIDAFRGFPQFN
jgi:hypothetical protein